MTRSRNRKGRNRAPILLGNAEHRRASIKAMAGQSAPYAYDERTTELLTMLRSMRPHSTNVEREFVEQWVSPLGTTPDEYGNHWLTIGDSRILWSCHTDTVHDKPGTQYVGFTAGCAYTKASNCLGSDDTTGVWIMRQMILQRVPGTYVFHRGEEVGGLGSAWIARNTPERLRGIDFAIAFDRMGYTDVITSQMDDCASEAFAYSLVDALHPLAYEAADGIFTDTANYIELIPECSNISVGYHSQHTGDEWQDVDFAMRLLDRLVTADFSALQARRDPSAYIDRWDRREAFQPVRKGERGESWLYRDDNPYTRATLTMDDLCRQCPEVVSDFLTSCGYDVDELKRYGGID